MERTSGPMVAPAPASAGASEQRATSPRARRSATARPIHPEDTALVERTTLVLRALELVDPGLPALSEQAEHASITVIGGARLPALMPRAPRRLKPRGWRPAAALWLFSAALVALGMLAPTAIGQRIAAPRTFAPRGAIIGTVSTDISLANAWATGSGIARLDIGGGAGPGMQAPGSAGLPVKTTKSGTPPAQNRPPSSSISPAPVHPWPPSNPYMYVPGHPAFGMNDPNGYYSWAFGQCTWWAQWTRRDEYLEHMGNAHYWASAAAARGYRVGSVPIAGATVVFQPGVQGAGGAGHVAHVEAVYPDGWFLVSEMNFYWNGGGWGRVDYRFAHSGWGVAFIY